jgi:hypothetical protein
MARKRYSPEQIVTQLREAEVLLSQGQTIVFGLRPDWTERVKNNGDFLARNELNR